MADTSDYTIEERIVTSTWVHERPRTGKTLEQVRTDFEQRFGRQPPQKTTLLRWEKKLFATGSDKDKPRSGRPSTREEQCREVAESVERSPTKSTRKRSTELGIPLSTLRKHMKHDLKLHPYRPKSCLLRRLSSESLLKILKIMEEQLFIKTEPEWLSDTEEFPNNDDMDHTRDIKIEDCPATEFVSCIKTETPPSDLKEDVEEETLYEEIDASGNHIDETENTNISAPCGSSFIQDHEGIKGNLSSDSGQKPYSCSICGGKFTSKGYVKLHMLIHTGERPFVCDTCGAKFIDKGKLNRHSLIHSGQRPFSCCICGKRFILNSELKRHLLVHGGQKPFSCGTCHAKFTEKASLKKHMISHLGLKLYSCSICGANVSRQGDLKRHMFIHSGHKPYVCSTCGAKFTQNGSLNRHARLHSGKKPH